MAQPYFSVVIPSCNEGAMLHMTVDDVCNTTAYPHYEVIVVDDGSTDGSADKYRSDIHRRDGYRGAAAVRVVDTPHIGVARARNAGFEQAHGDYVVFMDAHCKVTPDWLTRFGQALNHPQVAVVGPTFTQLNQPEPKGCGMMWTSDLATDTVWYVPQPARGSYDVPLTPGGCQAFRADTFRKIGRYDEGFARWGSEDLELCFRAWSLGYRVQVDPAVEIQHHFRTQRRFTVNQDDIAYNFLRMITFHFGLRRVQRIIARMASHPDLEQALVRLHKSDARQIRQELDQVRRHDDDWFFGTFG